MIQSNPNSSRRVFMMQVMAAGSALTVSQAMAQAKVDEKDPQASALGYVSDTTKVDTKKYPKHTPDQKCASCQLYTGKAGEPAGPCPLFAGKLVSSNGWCSAYVKKA